LIFLFFIVIVCKAFYIQIIKHRFYIQQYSALSKRLVYRIDKRGDILDACGRTIATDYPVYDIFVDPKIYFDDLKQGKSDKKFLKFLEKRYGIKNLNNIISTKKDRRYLVIKRNLSSDDVKFLKKNRIPASFGFTKRYERYYPDGAISSHIVGFCDRYGVGIDGLELKYNGYLKGTHKREMVGFDSFKTLKIPAPDAKYRLNTTLNEDVQAFLHEKLADTVKEYKAKFGIALVMNPNNGAIVAMDSTPYYDNNKYYSYKYKYIRNRALTDVFEPGSIFKLVAMSAALDSNKFNGSELINCGNGRWRIKNRVIHDAHRYKILSFDNVFIKSSNIGSAKIALQLGKKIFYEYLIRFGFGEKTGIDEPSESKGIVKDLFSIGDVDLANMAFGQGISVTAIQMVRAYSVIANGGYRVKPYIVNNIKSNNKIVYSHKSKPVKILKSKTVDRVRNILINVVKNGTGKRAYVDGYTVAGKTGTAQIPYKGKYGKNRYVASFVGFAPARKPKFVVGVFIFDPKGKIYGGEVAAPLFAKITTFLMHYYAIKGSEGSK